MKKLAAFLVAASLAGLVGCHNQSGTGGAPPSKGGTPPGGSSKAGKFSIVQESPHGTVDVTQGDMTKVELGLERENNYGGDVKVKAVVAVGPEGVDEKDVPKSLKIDLPDDTFKGADPKQKLQLTVGAAANAKVGDYAIQVTGTPAKAGEAATGKPLEIKVHVKEKKK